MDPWGGEAGLRSTHIPRALRAEAPGDGPGESYLSQDHRHKKTSICLGCPGGASGKESACQGRRYGSLGQEDALEEEMATHSSVLAWRIPRTEGRGLAEYSLWSCKESDTTEATQHARTANSRASTRERRKKKDQWLVSTHQLTPIRMATIQKKRNRNSLCWEGCGEIGTHPHCCWEHKMGQPLWKTVEQLLERLKIKLPHDAAIPRGSTDPKELTAGLC